MEGESGGGEGEGREERSGGVTLVLLVMSPLL